MDVHVSSLFNQAQSQWIEVLCFIRQDSYKRKFFVLSGEIPMDVSPLFYQTGLQWM